MGQRSPDTFGNSAGLAHESFQEWLKDNQLMPGEYYLIVGRFVPENNFETMIGEFMKSGTKRNLAIVTTANGSFFKRLEERLHFEKEPRIRFTGSVYEKECLKQIRKSAYAYLHGHEVGGTNPSLLEAMGCTKLNLLLDIGFNREVGGDCALYWTKKKGSLEGLIDRADAMSIDEREEFGEKAKNRIGQHYCWKHICRQYEALFFADKE